MLQSLLNQHSMEPVLSTIEDTLLKQQQTKVRAAPLHAADPDLTTLACMSS
jgi:hypothetical protein